MDHVIQSPRMAVPESVEMESKARHLDERLAEAQIKEDDMFRKSQKQTDSLLETARVENVGREASDEISTKAINKIREFAKGEEAGLRHDRNARETNFELLIVRQNEDTQAELQRISAKRKEANEGFCRAVGEEVCDLYAGIEQGRKTRMEQGEKLVVAMEAQFDEIRVAISAEKKIRAEAETNMLNRLKDMCSAMSTEMEEEKTDREASEEKVLSLLERVMEGMCNRMEGTTENVRSNYKHIDSTRASFLYGQGGRGSEPGSPASPGSRGSLRKQRTSPRNAMPSVIAVGGEGR